MKRAGHLFERIATFQSLNEAAVRAARGKRASADTLRFMFARELEVLKLEREVIDGTYRPRPYRTFWIRDPKPRRISAAAFRDRVVHHALCAALEPIFERVALDDSFACRRGKGQQAAVRRLQAISRRSAWYLKIDVEHFFETASHGVLKSALRRVVKDRRALELCDRFIDAGAPNAVAGRGLPIGNLTSQHFANFYLVPLDRFIAHDLRVLGWTRYMDDVVIFGPDRRTMHRWRRALDSFATEKLGLRLKPSAERLQRVSHGVPFLGFRIWPRLIRLDGARKRRLRDRVRRLELAFVHGLIGEDELQARVQSVVAWTGIADAARLRASLFATHDDVAAVLR